MPNDQLKQKRQLFHRLLIALGEEKYKEIIVEGAFPGIESTMELNETQLDKLISNAQTRIGKRGQDVKRRPSAPANSPEQYQVKQLRNKCLQVLSERGIRSTAKDWSAVNNELSAPRYQWVMSDEQRSSGIINKRGLGTFNTPETLRKLFYQLCAIRDSEAKIKGRLHDKAAQN